MSRIRRDKKHDALIERLTKGEESVFSDIWHVLIFAAFVGAKNQKRYPIKDFESGKAIPLNYLQPSCGPGFLSLLGIHATEGNEILRSKDGNHDAQVLIFEEYANAGMEIISERVDSASSPIEAILALIDDGKETSGSIVLEGLI
jgi:dnd system-associated protein 4